MLANDGSQLAHLDALHRVKEARMNVWSDLLGWASSSDHGLMILRLARHWLLCSKTGAELAQRQSRARDITRRAARQE